MSKTLKYLLFCLLLLVVFFVGVLGTYQWLKGSTISIEEKSSVLLEKIQSVTKLVSVEGHFSEIYEHESIWEPLAHNPLVIPLFSPSFKKKALIIVKAKVSVGYDLEKMELEVDHSQRKIIIRNIPEPEIIALDHDLEYYDIQESTFNNFSKEELTVLNKNAKDFIRKEAEKSDLFPKAEEQGKRMIEIIEFMVSEAGFEVEYGYADPIQDALND